MWGGAAKTVLIELERAQRAVLRVMLCKPFRYNTDELYRESRVLRVRQLFLQLAATAVHSITIKSKDYEKLVRQRVYKIPIPSINTTFARRQPHYILPFIYNSICRKADIKTLTTRKAKQVIEALLLKLDYEQTEDIINAIA